MNSQILLYEGKPKYDWWLKLILGGVLALTFILGLVFLSTDPTGAYVLLGITVLEAIVFWSILPQRFLIYQDRLVIKLGGPFAVNVKLTEIKEAKQASARKVFMYWGNRFATSTSGVIEIVRRKGMGIIISPAESDMFLKQLNKALRPLSNTE